MRRDGSEDALAYLGARAGAFWRWSDDGEALEWRSGPTIVLAAELLEVLWRLAPHGLPAFEPLVLLLAACRDGFAAELYARLPSARVVDLEVPASLRKGPEGKALLADLVFGAERAVPAPEAEDLLAAFVHDLGKDELVRERTAPALPLPLCVMRLRLGLREVSELRAELRRTTGLDEPVRPAESEWPACRQVRALLEGLRDDAPLAGLAELAKALMAAVHVPHPLEAHEELPVGGISDLANRGPFDRLLASELAQDDEVLLARVALGEALYFRRESPPRARGGRRELLLDTGVRMWGTPRVFAAAVALALAATTEPARGLRAFTARGPALRALDLTARAGVAAMLAELEAAPEPGAALLELARRSRSDAAATELIVITHDATLADPAFTQALGELRAAGRELLVATVDARGTFRLLSFTARGSTEIERATLDLRGLLPASDIVAEPRRPGRLPAIYEQEPLPFRLAHAPRVRSDGEGGLLSVSKDGCLVHSRRSDAGAGTGRLVSALLPRGRSIWLSTGQGQCAAMVHADEGDRVRIAYADLESGRVDSHAVTLASGRRRGFLFRNPLVHVVDRHAVQTIDAATGTVHASLPLPAGTVHHHLFGNSFFDAVGRRRLRLAGDGPTVRLVDAEIGLGHVEVAGQLRAVLPTGAVWVVEDGRLVGELPALETSSRIASFLAASDDGTSLLVGLEPGFASIEPDWETPDRRLRAREDRSLQRLGWQKTAAGHVRVPSAGHRPSVYRTLSGIAAAGGMLSVRTRKGTVCRIPVPASGEPPSTERDRVYLLQTGEVPGEMLPFVACPAPEGHGYSLAVATWPNGAKAYFDGRGLLHLVAGVPGIPEVSILLSSSTALAMWSSDDLCSGPEQLLSRPADVPAGVMLRIVRDFAEHVS